MLHPTIPIPFFHISLTHSPPSPYPSQAKVDKKDMESVQVALKTSFQNEQQQQQEASWDELCFGNAQKAEEFSVDDLLDFSNGELDQFQEDQQHQTEEDTKQHKEQQIVCSPPNYATVTNNSSVTDDFGTLSVPVEDLDNLEWLSQFVEDSFCEYSLTYPAAKPDQRRSEPEKPVQETNVFTTPVQTKARSKRTRSGLRVWSPLTDSSSTSSSSSTTSVMSPVKKKNGNVLGGTQQPRRCSHCGVQKTPQWRAGPLGSKTLCNACGVRFKSGRLLPEYRPACSPTFSSELHSNSHRKVLEMRRKKEGEIVVAPPV
ncbi:zinc finger transcription factor [Lithospermum erythrorhizon]|uniref:Zinc finger transcription factor n=1 Tax=Lithospermum erythrorhizon TaxID=34254 RepID=A0AAV3QEE0_LITER